MATVALFLTALFWGYIFRNYVWRIIKTRLRGTETEAQVCRIEKDEFSCPADCGRRYPVYRFYAAFKRQDGKMNEVRLLNPKKMLSPGTPIRIRYLDENVSFAVLTEVHRT